MFAIKATPSNALRILFGLFLVYVALASFDFLFHLPLPPASSIAYIESDSYRIEADVVDSKRSGDYQQLTVDSVTINEQTYTERMLMFVPLFPDFVYGDHISTRCNVEHPEPFDGFAYDRYLASKSIYATCFSRYAPLLLSHASERNVNGFLWAVRRSVIERIDRTFGEPEGSLLAGLLLGEKRFSDAWQERFIATGTSHVVAASGYNVAISVYLAFVFLTHIGVKRQYAFFGLLAAIGAYVVLAGGEAAVVRAGVMAAVVLFARQIGRKADMVNAILLTACVMLAVNPHLLRDDVGFQLSLLSTIALLSVAPRMRVKLGFIPEIYGIRESISATLAATLFTLPLILLSFGRVSIVGPIANLFILPLVPYAMLFGAIAIVVAFVSPHIAGFVAGPAWLLLFTILGVIRSLAALPFASIAIPSNILVITIAGSIILFLFLWHVVLRKPTESLSQ